jgi:hypothetical protein
VTLCTKLNLGANTDVTLLDVPEDVQPLFATPDGVTARTTLRGDAPIRFVLAFVTTLAQIEAHMATLAPRLEGDAVLWFAYPKGSSKRYRCEFNRDTGWAAVGAAGFEPVRNVAIDADWTALRFRRVEYISSLTRRDAMLLSPAGKARKRAP